ncbi:hypothetical protein EDB19DRAFT_1748230, partial [Suillus lakei]
MLQYMSVPVLGTYFVSTAVFPAQTQVPQYPLFQMSYNEHPLPSQQQHQNSFSLDISNDTSRHNWNYSEQTWTRGAIAHTGGRIPRSLNRVNGISSSFLHLSSLLLPSFSPAEQYIHHSSCPPCFMSLIVNAMPSLSLCVRL